MVAPHIHDGQFDCAYDGLPSTDRAAAHVFPDAIGGITSSIGRICRSHNNKVNSEVENPALPFFAPFRSLWGLAGRNGAIPPAPATLEFPDGSSYRVQLGPDGEMRHAVVVPSREPDGRKTHMVIGRSPGHLDQKMAEMSRKNPGLKWKDVGFYEMDGRILTEVDPHPGSSILRRLAAKVAFERFAQLRNGTVASGGELAAIRDFILRGAEPPTSVGLIGEENLYQDRCPLFVQTGNHFVLLAAQRNLLGAVVSFFGLYYYWVILARPYSILAPWDDPLVESPVPRRVHNPQLRAGVGTLILPWERWVAQSLKDPAAVEKNVHRLAMNKLQASVDSFYDDADETNPRPDRA